MIAYGLLPRLGRFSILLSVIALAFVLTLGCSSRQEEKPGPKAEGDNSPVIATVGKRVITASELKSTLGEGVGSLPRKWTKEELEKRLDEMMTEELLCQEAMRLKLDQDPEIRKRMHQMLSQKLLDQKLKEAAENREIQESEIRKYYEEHQDDFNRPEQVRVADIYISVPAGATDAQRADSRKKAETALDEALKATEKRTGFGGLIEKYSDSPEKYRKGDTGFIDIQGKPIGIDKRLAEAAFKLGVVGSVSESLIETEDGYHIVMLIGKRAPVQKSLESVKNELKQRIQREAMAKTRQTYIENLKQKTETKVDTRQLSATVEELNRKARETSTPSRIPFPPGAKETPPPLQGKNK
jgi:peptidyl-prolyl cis-trans isomerase C